MEPDVSLPSYLLTTTRFTQLFFLALPSLLSLSHLLPVPSNVRNTVVDPLISKWCILPSRPELHLSRPIYFTPYTTSIPFQPLDHATCLLYRLLSSNLFHSRSSSSDTVLSPIALSPGHPYSTHHVPVSTALIIVPRSPLSRRLCPSVVDSSDVKLSILSLIECITSFAPPSIVRE